MTNTVKLIGEMRFTGNIVPLSWYRHIVRKTAGGKTKPHALAIDIYADVVYWYRPTEIRDEITGQVSGYKKKFAADKLQKSYQAYADLFGESKTTVKRAIDLLVDDLDLMTREFRNIKSKTGTPLSNVMFLEPVVERLREITYEFDRNSLQIRGEVVTNLSPPPNKNDGTYTQTSSESTSKKTTEKVRKPSKSESAFASSRVSFTEKTNMLKMREKANKAKLTEQLAEANRIIQATADADPAFAAFLDVLKVIQTKKPSLWKSMNDLSTKFDSKVSECMERFNDDVKPAAYATWWLKNKFNPKRGFNWGFFTSATFLIEYRGEMGLMNDEEEVEPTGEDDRAAAMRDQMRRYK